MASTDDELAEACRIWQGGRDGGSTPIRAAARRLTGVSHYFSADWLRAIEDRAEADPTAIRRARALMDAVASSDPADAAGWCKRAAVPDAFVGRGLGPKEEDVQILASLRRGRVSMPLWGVSLSEEVARSFGEQWLFVLDGAFHGIAAWHYSGIKTAEQELIVGGCYEIVDAVALSAAPAVVRLREVAPLWPAS